METILVANRGEIACRVIRTAHALGYRTVAVFSEADAGAPHVGMADQAVRIGPAPVGESYLDPARILDAARRSGADAIHPGYGFLSEDAAFAQACLDAGLTFIGPSPQAISAMGDKARAKARMIDSGVPCVPGFSALGATDEALLAAAPDVGLPLLVKAAAGGGGRGMRRVDALEDLPEALQSARAEAENAFGDGALLLERLVTGARHVELQVVADNHGATIHLGERDCSVQRRHQKVVEEAPSPAVDEDLRARMGAAACAAAKAVDYTGVGTVEFLLAADGAFYFLEMNTRLQVEHPVTEAVTGLDLVALQLQIAEGQPLPLSQGDVSMRGHAIEVRLYAEDPAAGYRPQTGTIQVFRPAVGAGLRTDHGISSPGEVTAFYDPMIAKLIAYGADRDQARRRLGRALRETVLLGLRSNRGLLCRILAHPTFAEGGATTAFLEAHPSLTEDEATSEDDVLVAAAVLLEGRSGFRTAHAVPMPVVFSMNGERTEVAVSFGRDHIQIADRTVRLHRTGEGSARVRIDGIERSIFTGPEGWIQHQGRSFQAQPWTHRAAEEEAVAGDGRVRAPMAGRVLAVPVAVGDTVDEDTVVIIIEAMKLETRLRAEKAGVVAAIQAEVADTVSAGQILVLVEGEQSE